MSFPRKFLTITLGVFGVVQMLLSVGCGSSSPAAVLTPAVSISISPLNASLVTGQTSNFTATVTGTANATVTWAVDGVAGGNSKLGTISTAGAYTAPDVPPSPNTVSITATSAADPTQVAIATVTIVNPAPVLYSISPNTATAGDPDTTLTIGAADFTQQSVVYFGTTTLPTVYGSATQLTTTIPSSLLASTGTFSITVATPVLVAAFPLPWVS